MVPTCRNSAERSSEFDADVDVANELALDDEEGLIDDREVLPVWAALMLEVWLGDGELVLGEVSMELVLVVVGAGAPPPPPWSGPLRGLNLYQSVN